MRHGDGADNQAADATSGTQSQPRRRQTEQDDEEHDEQLNWAHLGRQACFPFNTRPCLSGFLLGPLSVQKKIRQPIQRRAREARANPANATRPQELVSADLEKQETANLTVICKEIERLLSHIQGAGFAACDRELEARGGGADDMTAEELLEMSLRHGLSNDGCVPLFDFCVNPRSFGQTVENLFYISFLIKEGSVGLNFDDRGLPTLGCAGREAGEEEEEEQDGGRKQAAHASARNQAVFALDFDVWEAIVESHGIKRSLIPHRAEELYDDGLLGEGGWYG
jgi:non-structural maintenance of chromosomes element 4